MASEFPGMTAREHAAGRNLRNAQRDLADAVKTGALVRRMNGKAYGYYVGNGNGDRSPLRSVEHSPSAPNLGSNGQSLKPHLPVRRGKEDVERGLVQSSFDSRLAGQPATGGAMVCSSDACDARQRQP
jgi:hypothetical protein